MTTTVSLSAVGDIWLYTDDNSDPFEKVKDILSDCDILFGNLETVLSNSTAVAKKAYVLSQSPEKIRYIDEIGFDVVNIANNHILDLGIEGFRDTLDILEKKGIKYIGGHKEKNLNNYAIIEINGIKFGFLGYSSGHWSVPNDISINKMNEPNILNDIAFLKNKCDHIIVSLHWGTEHVNYPSPDQIKIAHNLIEHGVSLILGHHSHTLQGIENYKNGLIAYSLGNFQFDPYSPFGQPNWTMILNVVFEEKGIRYFSIKPCTIDNNYKPDIPSEKIKQEIMLHISRISDPIITGKINNNWWFQEISTKYLSSNLNSYYKRIKTYGIFPLIECLVWLLTPFCLKCYLGIFFKKINTLKNAKNEIEGEY